MMKIPVSICVNRENQFYASICVCSILTHNPDAIIYLKLLKDIEELRPEVKDALNKLSEKDNIYIFKTDEYSGLPIGMPDEYMQYPYILQIDARCLVTVNIEELINDCILEKKISQYIFMVPRTCMTRKRADYCEYKLNIHEENYLDFTVCIINTEQYQAENVTVHCKEYLKKNQGFWFPEEDVLNILFGRKCFVLNQEWKIPVQIPVTDQRLEWYTLKTMERLRHHKTVNIWNYTDSGGKELLQSSVSYDMYAYICQMYSKKWISKQLEMDIHEFKKFEKYMTVLQKKDEKLKEKDIEISVLEQELENYKKMECDLKVELEEIKKSKSYKLAMGFTRIPRRIREGIYGRKEKGI